MNETKKYSRKTSIILLIEGVLLNFLMLWFMFHETNWWGFFNPWYKIIAFGIFLASVKLIISAIKDVFNNRASSSAGK